MCACMQRVANERVTGEGAGTFMIHDARQLCFNYNILTLTIDRRQISINRRIVKSIALLMITPNTLANYSGCSDMCHVHAYRAKLQKSRGVNPVRYYYLLRSLSSVKWLTD